MQKLIAMPLLLAAISGAAMAVQGTLNSQLTQKSSLFSATLVVHIIGTLAAVIVVLLTKDAFFEHKWTGAPWYLYLGGILSLVIVALVAFSISEVGVCNATTAIIIGQVGLAIIIDHFGLFGVEKLSWNGRQFLGLLLFATGARLLFR